MICPCYGAGDKLGKSVMGYHKRSDGIWTHGYCNLPSQRYFERFLATMAESVMTHLNILQGGPLHNTFLSNGELIDRTAIQLKENGDFILKNVDRYRWTPDTITGASGKVARIWVYKED